MKRFEVTAKQVITYKFEIEAENLMAAFTELKGKCIDHDTLGYCPEVIDWGGPDYLGITEAVDLQAPERVQQ